MVQINAAWILPRLYGEVYLPLAVLVELQHPKTPVVVREWSGKLPEWIHIREPKNLSDFAIALDEGESAAISLATEMRADWLLIDERDGTAQARRMGLKAIGVLGILLAAADNSLVDARVLLRELRTKTHFFLSAGVENEFLEILTQREQSR